MSIPSVNISLSNLVSFVRSNNTPPYSISSLYGFSNISLDSFSTGAISVSSFKNIVYLQSNLNVDIPINSASFPTVDRTGKVLTQSTTSIPTISNEPIRSNVIFLSNNSYITLLTYDIPSSYTKMCWVYPTLLNTSQGYHIISSFNGTPNHYLYYAQESNLSGGHDANGGLINYVRDPNYTPVNTWTHFSLTYDQATTTMKLYRNGTVVSSVTNAAMSWTGGSGTLGIGTYRNTNGFVGFLDNIKIFNTALASDQISVIYLSESNNINWNYVFNPSPVAYYDFTNTSSYSGSGSTSVNDLSGNGYNLVFNTAPTFNSSPKYINLQSANISAISSTNPIIDVTTNGFSVELLIRYPSNPGNFPIAFTYGVNANSNGILIQLQPTTSQIYLWNNYSGNGFYTSSGITLNTWYHVIFSMSSSSCKIYLNGSSVSTKAYTTPYSLPGNVNRYITVGDQSRVRSIGNIALTRFYNIALSSTNASILYNSVKNLGSYGLP